MLEGPFIEVGRIKIPFGTKPSLRCVFYDLFQDLLLRQKFIFLSHDGLFVPYSIISVSQGNSFFSVILSEVDNLKIAESLKSKRIYLPESEVPDHLLKDQSELTFSGLLNYDIRLPSGKTGKIMKIEEYPQQEIATIEIDGKSHLIPLNEAFIIKIDHRERCVYLDLPEGMWEL